MNDRYSRQSFLGDESESIFANVMVGVVGLGGGGSHIVQQLAHLGFKRYQLFDDDVVKDVNLNRMVGATTKDDESRRPKLEVALRTIHSVHNDAQIGGHPARWQERAEHLKSCHLVFGCVDGFAERLQLEQFTRRFLIAYIDIGMDVAGKTGPVLGGQVIASLPGHPCMRCMGFITDARLEQEAGQYGTAGPRPQVVFVFANGVLASVAVSMGVDLLTGWSGNTVLYRGFDGNRLTLAPLRFPMATHCPHYPLDEVGDVTFTPISARR